MKSKILLFEIINHLEEFESREKDLSFGNFVAFLQKQSSERNDGKLIEGETKDSSLKVFDDNTKRDVTVLITFMFKYAKYYLKKGLGNSIINTPDEFAFLVTLLRFESLTKTELINKLITEKTSGVETIKRLLKKGLLEEFKEPQNKKNVRVRISEIGKKELYSILPIMDKITQIITGNLTGQEVQVLLNILTKLDTFHHEIYFNEKLSSIEEIYETKIETA